VRNQRGVVVVGNYDARDAFGAAVGVEGVVCFFVRICLSYNPRMGIGRPCLALRRLAVDRVESALRLSC
jgi:hypothetical protein